jgi:hypothetical protein
MEQGPIDALIARVRKLERFMRLSILAWMLTALLFSLLEFTQMERNRNQVLRGEGLEIVDPAGHQRVRIGMTRDGASVLRLYDAAAQERLGLFVAGSGASGLVLFAAGEQQRAALTVLPAGLPQIRLSDDRGEDLFAAP